MTEINWDGTRTCSKCHKQSEKLTDEDYNKILEMLNSRHEWTSVSVIKELLEERDKLRCDINVQKQIIKKLSILNKTIIKGRALAIEQIAKLQEWDIIESDINGEWYVNEKWRSSNKSG